eukprot:2303365-Prymnesium_polylepis.1
MRPAQGDGGSGRRRVGVTAGRRVGGSALEEDVGVVLVEQLVQVRAPARTAASRRRASPLARCVRESRACAQRARRSSHLRASCARAHVSKAAVCSSTYLCSPSELAPYLPM